MTRYSSYEVGDEPTGDEMATYWKVQHFLRREWVAGWLEAREDLYGEPRLTQDEFELLVRRVERLDFSDDEDRALNCEYHELIEEWR